ncbi:hypothetical protein A2U01_0070817 [Trifolium medium]|uniref:Uncharacterized protein n=1 Tax=Trifolium medium TaxID=97028 RepID=A0A392SL28_9FABA|nr:hypothetical protein [Trifolium medium]
MEARRNEDTRTPRGYPNPVEYEFEVLLFIPVENWDEFGETRTLWVWERQNLLPTLPIAMPTNG